LLKWQYEKIMHLVRDSVAMNIHGEVVLNSRSREGVQKMVRWKGMSFAVPSERGRRYHKFRSVATMHALGALQASFICFFCSIR
jgi:hypothetical protein